MNCIERFDSVFSDFSNNLLINGNFTFSTRNMMKSMPSYRKSVTNSW